MNLDYTYCSDYSNACPQDCFYAQLAQDLAHRIDLVWLPISYASFYGKAECKRRVDDAEVQRLRVSQMLCVCK